MRNGLRGRLGAEPLRETFVGYSAAKHDAAPLSDRAAGTSRCARTPAAISAPIEMRGLADGQCQSPFSRFAFDLYLVNPPLINRWPGVIRSPVLARGDCGILALGVCLCRG